MALGDTVSNLTSLTSNNTLDLQPAGTVEWCIHNVYYAGAVELYMYDGSDTVKYDADTTYGARHNLCIHCTNTTYARIKNVSGGTAVVGYDGVITHT